MEIIFLGTGAPLNTARATIGMVVTAEGCAPLLIDTCGGLEVARHLHAAGFNLSEIRNVIVTHRHLDHAGGMMALLLAHIPLDVYALADTYTGILETKAGCFPELELNPSVVHHRIEAGGQREIGGFGVEFFAVEHRVPTVAVRVHCRGRTLAFSADSLPCNALVAAARDADLFVCDAICAESDGEGARRLARMFMHSTAKEAAEIARRADADRLACVHIGRFGSPQNILEEAQTVFGGKVCVPDDGDRVQV